MIPFMQYMYDKTNHRFNCCIDSSLHFEKLALYALRLLFGFALLLFFSCDSSNPTKIISEMAVIRGVVLLDNTPDWRTYAYIKGTNLSAKTDTNGNFELYPLRAGTYTLNVSYGYDTILSISENDYGKPIILDTIFLSSLPDSSPRIYSISVLDSATTTLCRYVDNYRQERTVYIKPSNFYLYCRFLTQPPIPDSITIRSTTGQAYRVATLKDRIETGFFQFDTEDTLTFSYDEGDFFTLIVRDSSYLANNPQPRLKIVTWTSGTGISQSGYGSMCRKDNPCYTFNTTTGPISYPSDEIIDWDLLLVNDSTGDSCYWQTCSNRSCLFPGEVHLKGDGRRISRTVGDKYLTDQLTIDSLIDGTYTLYATAFEGPDSSFPAVPMVGVESGIITKGHNSFIADYYAASPIMALEKKDVWHVGYIKWPDCTLILSSQSKDALSILNENIRH